MNQLAPLKYIFYIGAPPAKVWEAIVGADGVRKLFFGARLESTFEPGSDFRYVGLDGKGGEVNYVTGKVLECTSERRITMLSIISPITPKSSLRVQPTNSSRSRRRLHQAHAHA